MQKPSINAVVSSDGKRPEDKAVSSALRPNHPRGTPSELSTVPSFRDNADVGPCLGMLSPVLPERLSEQPTPANKRCAFHLSHRHTIGPDTPGPGGRPGRIEFGQEQPLQQQQQRSLRIIAKLSPQNKMKDRFRRYQPTSNRTTYSRKSSSRTASPPRLTTPSPSPRSRRFAEHSRISFPPVVLGPTFPPSARFARLNSDYVWWGERH